MSLLKEVLQLVTDEVSDQVKHAVQAYTRRLVRRAIRLLVLCMVGLTFLAVGFVFVLFGTATYLAEFMSNGLAFGLVGLIAALAGIVLILLVRR